MLANGFRENNRMNYENDDARALLPASWRITTYFRRAGFGDESAICPTQNGHVS
jgi:hypothetical protein